MLACQSPTVIPNMVIRVYSSVAGNKEGDGITGYGIAGGEG